MSERERENRFGVCVVGASAPELQAPTLGSPEALNNKNTQNFLCQTRDLGFSENGGYLIWGVLLRRILLFRVLYWGPLFSETPKLEFTYP